MRFRSLCLVMALLALPFAAQAQPFQGLYIGAGAGVYWPESINVQTAVLGSSRTQLDPSVGFAGLASVGYALGNGFRFELEGNYRTAISLAAAGHVCPISAVPRDLWRSGQCAVRYGCASAMAVSLRRWWRGLWLDTLAQSRRDAPGWVADRRDYVE